MKNTLPTIAAALLAASSAFAQQTPPPATPAEQPLELIAARDEHIRAMQRATIPTLTAYARKLESLQALYTRDRKTAAVSAVSAELEQIRLQIKNASTVSAGGNTARLQLVIVSATFGEQGQKHTMDVTAAVKGAHEKGRSTLHLTREEIAEGKDPAPYRGKTVTITYTFNGEQKVKTVQSGTVLNFKEQLK